jgi:acid phosphatase
MMDGMSRSLPRFGLAAVLLLHTLGAACASRSTSPGTAPPPPAPVARDAGRQADAGRMPDAGRLAHENLNAVLWMQTSVEYRAVVEQAYRLARLRLDAALADPAWTAATEQVGDFGHLPPAVVLDLDETVLDNSAFQARQTRTAAPYSEAAWNAWCEERRADALPGAVEFLRYARERGVAAYFITNREFPVEDATRDVLTRLGIEHSLSPDTVLTRCARAEAGTSARCDRPEWDASDKTSRRREVARSHRILLLIGDDLGDFVPSGGTVTEREARVAPYDGYWGTKWIAIPNPTYGSWERALLAGQPRLDDADVLKRKFDALETKPKDFDGGGRR